MEREAKALRLQRRFRCWVRNREEWQLILLTVIVILPVWVLCNILLPQTLISFIITAMSIYMARWVNTTKAKRTCVRKSPRSSSRTDLMGEQPRPRAAPGSAAAPGREIPLQLKLREGEEGSAGSPRPSSWIPQQGQLWSSSRGGEAASAQELPRETEHKAPAGRSQGDSSSQLPGNRPCIGNMEELSRSLMDSLDIIAVCHDLMEELKATCLNSRTPALRKSKSREYLVCLQCRGCVTSSCPHYSKPEEQQDLPVLVVILHGYYVVGAKCKVAEMTLDLKFELVIAGKPVYKWEKAQLLYETDPETCYTAYDWYLPTSPWGCKSSKVPHPVLRTPQGQMRPTGQDTRAAPGQQPRTKRSDAGSTALQPAGQGESLPSAVPTRPSSPGDSESSQGSCPILRAHGTPEGQTGLAKDTRAAPKLQVAGPGESLPNVVLTYPRPPWAQPPSPAALERLCRAGLEPLPPVGFKGLRQGLSLKQCIWHTWATVKRKVGALLGYLCIARTGEPSSATEWEKMVRLDLQRRVDALLYTRDVVA